MNKSAISILDLLDEELTLPNAPIPRRDVIDIPDAIVLCIVETVCRYCKTSYSHPNPSVLGRYEKHHKKISKWSSLFESLPREMLRIKEDSTSCQNCFERGVLRTNDVEREQ